MTEISRPDSLLMLRLRSTHSALQVLSAQVASHDRLLYQIILPAMTRPGPPSSPQPDPSATPGKPWFNPSSGLMKRAKALGEWVGRAARIMGLIKGIWVLVGIVTPWLLMAATAVWKLLAPYLSRLLLG